MASFQILTFGCKVNQCDSQILRETLDSWGLTEASLTETGLTGTGIASGADLVVINTCTVTGTADAKFRKAIRRVRRQNPDALVAVTGCYANRTSDPSSELPGAHLVFRTRDPSGLADFLGERGMLDVPITPGLRSQSYFAEHTRAFLKIQDGCDCFCTYCIVPIARPKLWSKAPEKVIATINRLSSKGYREVALTGIHLGFFGRDSAKNSLHQLLSRIEKECEIQRIRLSSIEINEVSDEMLDLIANSKKLCHHLHLPLQSGDNEILRKMGRKYSSPFFIQRIEEIRKRIPDIGLTTDLMVGFPGETREQFERTCNAVENIGFMKIHVFGFSPRPGTKAAEMDSTVPPKTIRARTRQLIALGNSEALKFKQRFIGETVRVLAESSSNGGDACVGLSSNYLKVKVLDARADCINRVLPVRLTGLDARTGLAVGRPA